MGWLSGLFGAKDKGNAENSGQAGRKAAEIAAMFDDPKANRRIVLVGGMMCEKCEARVKAALEAVPGVLAARPSHDVSTAIVVLEKDVEDAALEEAVRGCGYEARGVKHFGAPSRPIA